MPPTVLQRFRALCVYLDRGISPAVPKDTSDLYITYNGCALVSCQLDEQEKILMHSAYNFPDGDIILVAQKSAYSIHRSRLRKVSAFFDDLLDYDEENYIKCSSPCLLLIGCSAEHIELALGFIYPAYPGMLTVPSRLEWALISEFSFTYSFDSLWLSSERHSLANVDFIHQISIGRRRSDPDLIRIGCEAYARSSSAIPHAGSKEAEILGYDGLEIIYRLRQEEPSRIGRTVDIAVAAPDSPLSFPVEPIIFADIAVSTSEAELPVNRSVHISDSITRVEGSPTMTIITHSTQCLPSDFPIRPSHPEAGDELIEGSKTNTDVSHGNSKFMEDRVGLDSDETHARPQSRKLIPASIIEASSDDAVILEASAEKHSTKKTAPAADMEIHDDDRRRSSDSPATAINHSAVINSQRSPVRPSCSEIMADVGIRRSPTPPNPSVQMINTSPGELVISGDSKNPRVDFTRPTTPDVKDPTVEYNEFPSVPEDRKHFEECSETLPSQTFQDTNVTEIVSTFPSDIALDPTHLQALTEFDVEHVMAINTASTGGAENRDQSLELDTVPIETRDAVEADNDGTKDSSVQPLSINTEGTITPLKKTTTQERSVVVDQEAPAFGSHAAPSSKFSLSIMPILTRASPASQRQSRSAAIHQVESTVTQSKNTQQASSAEEDILVDISVPGDSSPDLVPATYIGGIMHPMQHGSNLHGGISCGHHDGHPDARWRSPPILARAISPPTIKQEFHPPVSLTPSYPPLPYKVLAPIATDSTTQANVDRELQRSKRDAVEQDHEEIGIDCAGHLQDSSDPTENQQGVQVERFDGWEEDEHRNTPAPEALLTVVEESKRDTFDTSSPIKARWDDESGDEKETIHNARAPTLATEDVNADGDDDAGGEWNVAPTSKKTQRKKEKQQRLQRVLAAADDEDQDEASVSSPFIFKARMSAAEKARLRKAMKAKKENS
ncbi:hypothetical protein HWV62_33851 [Athelia sp. TMB]|nr:hypothetical protein HWV62_33851 [Athelia sp. TMB]